VTVITTPEVHSRLKQLSAPLQVTKNFEFITDCDLTDPDVQKKIKQPKATAVEMIDSPDYAARRNSRSTNEAAYIEIGIDKKGISSIVGMPPDFDYSIADGIKLQMKDPASLKVGSKVNNLPLVKIVQESDKTIYVFKPLP
jgi:hypothetical protein